jgi:hypothetical protein
VALRLAACSDHPVFPSGPLGVSPDPPLCPPASGPRGVSVPSGPFGVPPYSPVYPPVPLVFRGSYSSIVIVYDSAARGRCALSWCLAARCPSAF